MPFSHSYFAPRRPLLFRLYARKTHHITRAAQALLEANSTGFGLFQLPEQLPENSWGLHQVIAHIVVLQDQPASAHKTGKEVNAEEMNGSLDASMRAGVESEEICVLIGTVDQRQLSWYYHWGGTNENAYACTCNYCNAIKVWSLLRSWERRGHRRDVDVFLGDAQTLVSKYWQAGTVKNRENVSCELRVCRRDKSKTDRQIRKGTGLKLQVYSVSLEDEW
ncbi:hypothetical protein BJV77DRAFT_962910 [Russula vinacea]|nr:hypothetical protein BJV77DRAFT_962910 [Russula vinacea]